MEDIDGSGFSLTIPGLMISRDDAAILKLAVKEGQKVMLQSTIEIAHPEADRVELGLWFGSILDLPVGLLEELYDY
jgi:hypothetical protein